MMHVYDVEDILDEFRWYELKVSIEGHATELSPLIEFFHNVTQGNFNNRGLLILNKYVQITLTTAAMILYNYKAPTERNYIQ
jgi:hypothetical protein